MSNFNYALHEKTVMQFQNPTQWLLNYGNGVKLKIMSLSENIDIEYVQNILCKYVLNDKEYNEKKITEKLSQVEMIALLSKNIEDFEHNCATAFLGEPLQLSVFK